MKLPATVQEIADVIGREKALSLVGQLPRSYVKDARWSGARNPRVVLYVPQRLNTSHPLVQMIGWDDACKLVREFRGMLMQIGSCQDIIRRHQNENIARLRHAGLPSKMIAEWFNVSDRHVRMVAAENPPQANMRAANDNAPTVTTQAQRQHGSTAEHH